MILAQHGMLGFPTRAAYYVSEAGTGSGLSPSDPMSQADFLLLTLAEYDKVFFLEGDEF